jgi:Arm DNA-binding domain
MLTDVQICKAKAAARPYKLTDGGGLHVCVTPSGGKLWRLRYEFDRKEKLLSIGPYPSVGVRSAGRTGPCVWAASGPGNIRSGLDCHDKSTRQLLTRRSRIRLR